MINSFCWDLLGALRQGAMDVVGTSADNAAWDSFHASLQARGARDYPITG